MKPQLKAHMTSDVTISEARSSVAEATEIEAETVGMRTEQEEALAGTP